MFSIIKQIKKKIKSFLNFFISFLKKDSIFYTLLIIFASSISFFLGSLSEYEKNKKEILKKIEILELKENQNEKKLYYLASKHGKRYYLPWCYSGNKKNQIKFKTRSDAEKAGYTPAKNCEGL